MQVKVEFGPPKSVSQNAKQPDPGYYSVGSDGDISTLNWTRCREQFQKYLVEKLPGFYFSTESTEGSEKVASFLAKTEEIIELGTGTEFSKTNLNFALWLSPAKFWLKCPVRASLLTILLRCGNHYNPTKDNYEEALYSVNYVTRTILAVQRFLFGFTEFIGRNSENRVGWVTIFQKLSEEQVRKNLISTNFQNNRSIVGAGKIWG